MAIVATTLSVAVMILSLSFINGFKYEVREKLFAFWGHVHVTQFSPSESSMLTANFLRRDPFLEASVRKDIPGVTQIAPYVVRPGILQLQSTMEGTRLKGIDTDYRLSPRVELKGRLPRRSGAYSLELVLSQSLANRLDAKVGSSIRLYFLEPGMLSPRIRKMSVCGIYHTGMDEIDREYAICDIRLLQHINGWSSSQINGYQIDLADAETSKEAAAVIYDRLLQPPLNASAMSDIFTNIFDWLELQNVNARIVIVIMAIVAMINLAVALLILIVDQARLVSILTALGMQGRDIRQIFFYHALLIAGCGILAGNALALGICWAQQQFGFLHLSEATYYMSTVPVRLPVGQVLIVDFATLVLAALCMWAPSLYVRTIQPARMLQFK
jgi:lipoprotein-releasing system permease protein